LKPHNGRSRIGTSAGIDLSQRDMVCVNEDDSGLITLFRVYPKWIDAKAQFEKELTDPKLRADLLKHNKLYEWYRAGKKIDGKHTPYMSFSTGFRNTDYNRDGTDAEAAAYPNQGGVFRWVGEAFGPRWGFAAIYYQWQAVVIWFPTVLIFAAAALAYVLWPTRAASPMPT
jgi:hypothetical protein